MPEEGSSCLKDNWRGPDWGCDGSKGGGVGSGAEGGGGVVERVLLKYAGFAMLCRKHFAGGAAVDAWGRPQSGHCKLAPVAECRSPARICCLSSHTYTGAAGCLIPGRNFTDVCGQGSSHALCSWTPAGHTRTRCFTMDRSPHHLSHPAQYTFSSVEQFRTA